MFFDYLVNWTSGNIGQKETKESPYGNIETFWSDFKIIDARINGLRGANGKLDEASFKTWNAVAAKLQHDDLKTKFAETKVSTTNTGRCGDGGGLLSDPGEMIKSAFCGMVDAAQGLIIGGQDAKNPGMLGTAINLMTNTAGISTTATEASWIPTELQGSMQGLFSDSKSDLGKVIRTVTNTVLGVVDIMVILLFLAMALASILQISLSTYSIKKLLPGIIIGFLVAHFSVFAVRAGLEVSDQVSGMILSLNSELNKPESAQTYNSALSATYKLGITTTSKMTLETDPTKVDITKVMQQGFLTTLCFIAAIFIFILGFLFVVRSIIFFFLTPLAPLAFFGFFVPPLKGISQRWSKLFTSWLFMPVVAVIWLSLGFLWLQSASSLKITSTQTFFGLSLPMLVSYVFGLVCFFFAIKTPFSMAGEASSMLNKWNALGKSAWDKTGGAALKEAGAEAKSATGLIPGVAKFRNYRKDLKDRTDHRRHSWAEGGSAGGAKQVQAKADQTRKRAEELEKKAQSLDEEREQIRQATMASKAVNDAKDLLERQKNLANNDKTLSDDQRADEIKKYTAAYNATVQKEIDKAIDSSGVLDKYAKYNKDLEKLKDYKNSSAGLGYRGRLFIRNNQQKSNYAKRQQEHKDQEKLVADTAERELRAGKSRIAHRAQHMSDEIQKISAYSKNANAEGLYAERTRFNESDNASWIRQYDVENAAFNELTKDDEKNATYIGALNQFRKTPTERPGQNKNDYNFQRAVWDKSKKEMKEIAGPEWQKMSSVSGNRAKAKEGIAALRGEHWQNNPNAHKWDNAQVVDHFRDKVQGTAAFFGSFTKLKKIGESGSNSLVSYSDIVDAAGHLELLKNEKDEWGRDIFDKEDKASFDDFMDYAQSKGKYQGQPKDDAEMRKRLLAFTEHIQGTPGEVDPAKPWSLGYRLYSYAADPHFAIDESPDWHYAGSHTEPKELDPRFTGGHH